MIKNGNFPLLKWKLLAVIETYLGADTMLRVRTENDELQKPVTELYKLPLL